MYKLLNNKNKMDVHLKDCQAWKDEKLEMSTTNNESAKLFDDVIHQYVTWVENDQNGGIEGTLKLLRESDPNFAMSNVLSIGLELMGTGRTVRLDTEFRTQVENLSKNKNLNERENLHCKAVVQFANDEYYKACDTWEEILVNYPNDILALKFAHDAYFYLGNSTMIRDSVGRVLPHYKLSNDFYGYLRGMYAFGLEEMNLYDLALKYATEALTLNPTDCWATHAKAHCFEMNGQTNQGINFMKSTENDWSKGAMLACHNYWHWALYHVEKGEYDLALGIYDQQVSQRVSSGAALDIVDAASLLQRFEFQGVNVEDRWEQIYDICRPHIDDHIMVFNDSHFLMSYLSTNKGKDEPTKKIFMKSVNDFIKNSEATTNYNIFSDLGVNLFQGLIAYKEKRFDDATEFIYPVKNNIQKIGGSHAQRDVFNQLLLMSCIQSKKKENINLGLSLIHERKLVKEDSPLTDRMMSKWLACHTTLD